MPVTFANVLVREGKGLGLTEKEFLPLRVLLWICRFAHVQLQIASISHDGKRGSMGSAGLLHCGWSA
jgi:hypothetical protein